MQLNESASHFFLHCPHYPDIRAILLNDLESVDENILNYLIKS